MNENVLLISDQFVRLVTQACLMMLVTVYLEKKPNFKRLAIWETVYCLLCFMVTFFRQHAIFMFEQQYLSILFIPIVMIVFEEKSLWKAIGASLFANAVLLLLQMLVVLLFPAPRLVTLPYGLTLDGIIAGVQLILVEVAGAMFVGIS